MARTVHSHSRRNWIRAAAALVGIAAAVGVYALTPVWTVVTTPTTTGYSIPKPPRGALVYYGTHGRWAVCAAVYPDGMYYSYVAYQGLHVAWPVNVVWKRGWGIAASWHRLSVKSTEYSQDIARVPSTVWPPTLVYYDSDGMPPYAGHHLAAFLASERWTITLPNGQHIVIHAHRQRTLRAIWPPYFGAS